MQMAFRDAANGIGHGGGEQGDLSLLRRLLQNPLHIIDEAHAQHFVRFVQHQCLQSGQIQRTAAHVVHYPTGSADHDMHTALQLSKLAAIVGAAVDGQHMEARHMPRVFLERFRDL